MPDEKRVDIIDLYIENLADAGSEDTSPFVISEQTGEKNSGFAINLRREQARLSSFGSICAYPWEMNHRFRDPFGSKMLNAAKYRFCLG